MKKARILSSSVVLPREIDLNEQSKHGQSETSGVDMDSQGFPERLVKIMEERDLKQVDLLHLASVQGVKLGKSQLSQYISGKTMPRPAGLNSLAELLGDYEIGRASCRERV